MNYASMSGIDKKKSKILSIRKLKGELISAKSVLNGD